VDSIQGNIREMRAEVKYWQGYQGSSTASDQWIANTKTKIAEALKESKDYLKYLDKESLKNQDEKNQYLPEYSSLRKARISNAQSTTKSTVAGLEQILQNMERSVSPIPASSIDSLVKLTIPLTLHTKLEKAKMHSFELMSHLEAKSAKSKNSKEHYDEIILNMNGINNSISGMNITLPPDILDKVLGAIESNIAPLTKQTPYTLLMMRVVEIGLPVLLSLFSIFFVLRYTLTERRSHEIKALLKQRNANLLKQPE
jgi:hypothetical protein